MPTPLTRSDQTPAESLRVWEAFLASRAELTGRMQLSACDGCDGCGLRCVEGFGVTREEWEAAKGYLATLPAAEVARVRSQEKTAPWPGAEDIGATTTYCRFRDLEKKNCFLYAARPTVCRLFGHTDWLPCPIEKVEFVPEGAGELWDGYRKFERKTWEGWEEEDARTLANQDRRTVVELL